MAQYSKSAISFRVPSLKLFQFFFLQRPFVISGSEKNRNSVALDYVPPFSNLVKASALEIQPPGRSCMLTVGGVCNMDSCYTDTKQRLCPVIAY